MLQGADNASWLCDVLGCTDMTSLSHESLAIITKPTSELSTEKVKGCVRSTLMYRNREMLS
jgi:hypothetical protein